MKKILLLATALTLSVPSGLIAASGGGDERAEIYRIAEPLINGWNASHVIEALRGVPAAEREGLVHLITAPATRLVMDNRENASRVINDLSYVPVAEREALVRLITAPATRLVRDDLGNVIDVIEALSSVPAVERRDRVIRARNHMDLPPEHPGFNQRLTQLLETPLDAPIPPLGGGNGGRCCTRGVCLWH
jgi:hypothetical protein